MIVEKLTTKGEFSNVLVKYKITREFIENQRVQFDLNGH